MLNHRFSPENAKLKFTLIGDYWIENFCLDCEVTFVLIHIEAGMITDMIEPSCACRPVDQEEDPIEREQREARQAHEDGPPDNPDNGHGHMEKVT
jgi:hypothetical protein